MKKIVKNKNLIKISSAFILLLAIAIIAMKYFYVSKNALNVVVKINDHKIYKYEFEKKLSKIFVDQGADFKVPEVKDLSDEVLKVIAREIYLEYQLTKEAKKSSIANSPKVKEKLEEVKNKIIRQSYLDSILENEITEDKIAQKYNDLLSEISGKKEYEIHHIIFENEKEAEKYYSSLTRNPKDFAKIAKDKSIDLESADIGGNLGYVIESNIIDEISEELPELKINKISKPIKTKFGWHIVKYTNVKEAEILPYEDVRDAIKAKLIQEKLNEINQRIIDNSEVEVILQVRNSYSKRSKTDLEKSNAVRVKNSKEDLEEDSKKDLGEDLEEENLEEKSDIIPEDEIKTIDEKDSKK
jgi:parvulin-like peptidyl-prolyl isomerase